MKNSVLIICLILPFILHGQRFGDSGFQENKTKSSEGMAETTISQLELTVLEGPINPDLYKLGPGDQIAIIVQTSEMLESVLTISPTGSLLVPGVGRVDLRGLTFSEGEQKLAIALAQNYKNARVSVDLVNIRKIRVAIVGAIAKPGYHIVSPISRITDLLDMAEARPLALLSKVKIKSMTGENRSFDVTAYYQTGNIQENPFLVEGDIVTVEYADLDTQVVVMRGAVYRPGYDVLNPGETLAELIARRIDFKENADLENIKIVRKNDGVYTFITVPPSQFAEFILKPGDDVEYLYEKPVNVQGRVATPGSFMFIPGYTAGDYVAMAGGLLPSGTMRKIKISRLDGSVLSGEDVVIQRGDIIEVQRSPMDIFLGEISVIQFVSTMTTVLLAVLAVK